ncbi:hypothetical protein VTN96DRAFT_9553 [Rasamsonia emersonii]|uniref:Transcription factor Iwr1 domain-containing protein n=1 Tax=Rasamsonia emersonii (strain ATCC 16479 / CBS 393.64 / IMI 116815) TaxID=1408163 RepID=A0A0F4Z422_RASE3|nr:hypothetical protein T310_0709 [Rasamsonia emersonii CBS 393.64]KKA25257.1 hypothetical protein T310_0709 [Rasamsonia emersonii CBS 393.64]
MALPPEHIKIKRRREEEPVETLYIQSQLHQTKRRFTDFVFQRVRFDGDEGHGPSDAVTPPTSAAKQNVRSPRSVSSSAFTSFPPSARATAGGVPVVRATSPGAEFREERQRAAARREVEERRKRALESTPHSRKASGSLGGPSPKSKRRDTPVSSRSGSPTFPTSLRRFQISRSLGSTGVLKAAGGGVQKKKGSVPAQAVLVEKLTRSPSVKAASALEELARESEDASVDTSPPRERAEPEKDAQEEPVRPRKRPVVNEAEKRWRESQKATIAAAKANITSKYDGADDLDRLAQELEQVVLDLEQNDQEMKPAEPIPPSPSTVRPVFPKPPPLKYQPKPPKSRSRTLSPGAKAGGGVQDTMQVEPAPPAPATTQDTAKDEADEDSDGDYVYDTYIRRPLPAGSMLTNPLLDLEAADDALLRQNGIDPTRKDIGVVVITEEDEYLWDDFAEDEVDEENWDGEDVDSNAEDNPANDYPDEELSSADEFDDPTAIYSRYRHGASDDEEYDLNEYDSEEERHGFGRYQYGYGRGRRRGHSDDDDDDEDGDNEDDDDY